MKFAISKLGEDIKELIISPKRFWLGKKEEEANESLFLNYLMPLLIVLAVAVFVGDFFKRSDFFFEYPILKMIQETLLFVLQYFVGVFFTKELMKTFGGEKNVNIARKLVAYSLIPLLLVSIITGLFEYFSILKVLGFYSFYLFWLGAEVLVELPKEKEYKYSMMVIFVNLLTFSFLSWILAKIFEFILFKI